MSSDDSQRAQRRQARASWPIRSHALGDEPGEDLSAWTTAEERLAMMWPLATAAYELGGPLPRRPRQAWPGRLQRGRDQAP